MSLKKSLNYTKCSSFWSNHCFLQPPPERERLEKKLDQMISRLQVRQLAKEYLPLFPNIRYTDVKNKMQKYKLPYKFVGKTIVEMLKRESDEAFVKMVNNCVLLDAVLKKSKIWRTYMMTDRKSQVSSIDLKTLERQVLQAVRIEQLNADLYSLERDNVFYVMVVMRRLRKNKGVLLSKPEIFAVSKDNLPYIFIANKLPTDKIKMFVRGNGYEKFKSSELTGKSVEALITILKNKCNTVDILDDISFRPKIFKMTSSNIYTQNEERFQYASHHFQEDSPCIEELSVDGPPEFKGKFNCSGKQFRTSMKISSKNLSEAIKAFAEKGMISPPFPNYIRKCFKLGRNHFKLKSIQSE